MSPTCRAVRRIITDRTWRPTTLARADITLVPDADDAVSIRPRTWYRFHVGTTEVGARIVARDVSGTEPFAARIVLDEPVLLRAGDRFVVRSSAPLNTIAGGVVDRPVCAATRAAVDRRACRSSSGSTNWSAKRGRRSRRREPAGSTRRVIGEVSLDVGRGARSNDRSRALGLLARSSLESIESALLEEVATVPSRTSAGAGNSDAVAPRSGARRRRKSSNLSLAPKFRRALWAPDRGPFGLRDGLRNRPSSRRH